MKTALLILPFLASTALGRIGETLEQCRTRYGKEVSKGEDGTTFKKGPLTVVITYWKDKAITVVYARTEGRQLSEEESAVLLELNAPAGVSQGDGAMVESRITREGHRTMLSSDGTLRLIDPKAQYQMAKERREEELAQARATLEGF